MKIKKTKIVSSALLAMICLVYFAAFVPAVQAVDLGLNYARNIGLSDAGDSDVRETAVDIIRYLLTFLGIIAVLMILYGGFLWMTANGSEDRIAKAKKTILAGVVGLIIILAAFAIVTFVIDIAQKAINGDF